MQVTPKTKALKKAVKQKVSALRAPVHTPEKSFPKATRAYLLTIVLICVVVALRI